MGAERQKTDKLHRDRAGGWIDNIRYKKDNGGYSIVELIIVLAIISALMGTAFYSVTLIFSANAKSTANDIQRAIGDCKVTAMGKSAAYMELYRDAANENVYTRMYVRDSSGTYVVSEPQKVGPARVTVKYRASGGAVGTETELSAGGSIQIWFDRATGGFKADGSGNLYEAICVEGGSKKYEIELTELTGKSEVKAK